MELYGYYAKSMVYLPETSTIIVKRNIHLWVSENIYTRFNHAIKTIAYLLSVRRMGLYFCSSKLGVGEDGFTLKPFSSSSLCSSPSLFRFSVFNCIFQVTRNASFYELTVALANYVNEGVICRQKRSGLENQRTCLVGYCLLEAKKYFI